MTPTTGDTIIYNVSDKNSYNGSFTETIPFNIDFYKLNKKIINE